MLRVSFSRNTLTTKTILSEFLRSSPFQLYHSRHHVEPRIRERRAARCRGTRRISDERQDNSRPTSSKFARQSSLAIRRPVRCAYLLISAWGNANVADRIHHERQMRVVCIGAGASGLCFAYKLQRSFNNFTLAAYEKNPAVSGTWFGNKYPGCAYDVPARNFVWSFEPKLDWKESMRPHRRSTNTLTTSRPSMASTSTARPITKSWERNG